VGPEREVVSDSPRDPSLGTRPIPPSPGQAGKGLATKSELLSMEGAQGLQGVRCVLARERAPTQQVSVPQSLLGRLRRRA
jgi:hypothetical protein